MLLPYLLFSPLLLSLISGAEGSRGHHYPSCDTLPGPICNCGKPGKGLCYSCAKCGSCDNCDKCERCAKGPSPPPAPPPCQSKAPPEDWADYVTRGDVIFSACDPGSFNSPNIGNGFLAFKLGPNCHAGEACMKPQNNGLGDGQRTLGGLHLAGVFNGVSNRTVSHRARLPSVYNVYIEADGLVPLGAALDVRRGVFTNRTRISSSSCNATVEHSVYAHHKRRNLLVLQLSAFNVTSSAGCQLNLKSFAIDFLDSPDVDFNVTSRNSSTQATTVAPGATTVASGVTRVPEVYGVVNRTRLALVFDSLPSANLTFSSDFKSRFLLVARTSIEQGSEFMTANQLAKSATRLLADVRTEFPNASLSPDPLFVEHAESWAAQWVSGIEVEGNMTVARAVNASLFYIMNSIRPDFPLGTSPGGLATDSYDGRSFWDTETWMFPVVNALYPGHGYSLLKYRLDRLPAAQARATQFGAKGAMFPWTSELTGYGCTHSSGNCPPSCTGLDWEEQHITADICMAFSRHWHSTANLTFLNESWPLISNACDFWISRLERKDGTGNWTVNGVVGPDESAGKRDDEIYTNAAATSCLKFGVESAHALGKDPDPLWSDRANSPFLPTSMTLQPGVEVHPEYDGYRGEAITQSSVVLTQYPLELPQQERIKINDLLYYEPRTRQNGFFTGDSVYSIAWLALGNTSAAASQWRAAFAHMQVDNFFVFREELTGGHSNFITGAGGFLQNILFGFAGLRFRREMLEIVRAPQLPVGVTGFRLRGVRYRGRCITFAFNADVMTVSLCDDLSAAVVVQSQETKHTLSPQASSVTLPLAPLAVLVGQGGDGKVGTEGGRGEGGN